MDPDSKHEEEQQQSKTQEESDAFWDEETDEDASDAVTYYLDSDDDEYGDANTTMDACVSFSPSGETFEPSSLGRQANTELLDKIQQAWEKELASVSQGAFVSREQYIRSLDQRINLKAQKEDNSSIWPMNYHQNQSETTQLEPNGKIVSWTKTTAAGSPSEFAFRSPILGGLTTVLIQFEKGTIGTFLIVDDHQHPVSINDEVELVIRRIYAQDGWIRYGLKAIPLKE